MTTQDLIPTAHPSVGRSLAPRPGGWHLVPVVLLVAACSGLVLAVLLTGQRPARAPVGLPDAGPVTAWTVMLTRTLMRLSAVGTVGCLVAACWLLPREAASVHPVSGDHRRLLRAAGRWAVGWMAAASVLMISASAQLLGIALPGGLGSAAAWSYVPELAEGRALMLSVPLIMVIATHAGGTRSSRGMHTLAAVALLALAPMALNGHAATAANHYVATQSLVLHVLAVTVWTGGLVGLLHLRVATDRETLVTAVVRFSPLALGCFVVVALSGVTSAGSRLGLDGGAWQSSYGALVAAKVAILVALAVVGHSHRHRTIPAIRHGRSRPFWSLVLGELVVMSAAIGLAVALARTSPPVRSSVVAAPHPGLRTVEPGLEPPTPARLLLEWHPDAVMVTVVAVATLWYLHAHAWSAPRTRRTTLGTLWVLAGAAVLLWSLCGGVAAYGSAMLSGHLVQLLLCALVAPRLVARGAELLSASPPSDGRVSERPFLGHIDPLTGAVLLSLFLAGVYATPALDLALRSPNAHLVVDALGVMVGALGVFATTSSTARGPQPRRELDRLTGLVLATLACGLLLTGTPPAEQWFAELGWRWIDPVADQRYAVAALLLLALTFVAISRGPAGGAASPLRGRTRGR